MKIKCIETHEANCLTIGKIYTALNEDDEFYTVINDVGAHCQYFKRRFEPIDEPEEEEITVTEMIDEEILEDVRKENVKMGMSLKERILNKLDYRSIAEQIYDRLEREIIDDVVCYIDEDQIVEDMVCNYKNEYLEVAREVVIESIAEDIDASEIEDHFKEVMQEKVDDM